LKFFVGGLYYTHHYISPFHIDMGYLGSYHVICQSVDQIEINLYSATYSTWAETLNSVNSLQWINIQC